jgi:hypothetical protein
MAKTKRVKRGDAGSATGLTAWTGVVEDSFVEDGVDDSAQVGTNNGDARWAAGSGDTAGVEHDGNEGSATGPTASTCVDEESFIEDGVDDSEQVRTDDGNAKRAAGSGDTAGKEDSDEVAVEQNGESLFSTSPNSDAAGTDNVLQGPSSGNSDDANNTNAIVGDVSAHIEKEKKKSQLEEMGNNACVFVGYHDKVSNTNSMNKLFETWIICSKSFFH